MKAKRGSRRYDLHDLKTWRERLGLTQEQAAHVLGLAVRTYLRYERGEVHEWVVPRCLTAAVRRAILRRGELSGTQRVSYPGLSMSITFPPDFGNQARYKRPTRRKASAPDPYKEGGGGGHE